MRLRDDILPVIISQTLDAAGRAVLAGLASYLVKFPGHPVRMVAADAKLLVEDHAALSKVAGNLAEEVQLFRANQRVERAAPPPRRGWCKNCRYFEPTTSAEAHVVPTYQIIVNQPGTCVAGPPTITSRGERGVVVASAFPLVHPERWCKQWELAGPDDHAFAAATPSS